MEATETRIENGREWNRFIRSLTKAMTSCFGPTALAGVDPDLDPDSRPPFQLSNAGMALGDAPIARPHPRVITATVGDDCMLWFAVKDFAHGDDNAALDFMLTEAKRVFPKLAA